MNNMISYQRFTNLPVNISQYGATAEEYELTKGKVEPNLMIAPMPTRELDPLLSPRSTSDTLRVGAPTAPAVNDYEGFRHDHLVVRHALAKGRSKVGGYITDAVRSDTVRGLSDDRRNQIMASLSRESNMCHLLGRLNRLQEDIFARMLGSSKG